MYVCTVHASCDDSSIVITPLEKGVLLVCMSHSPIVLPPMNHEIPPPYFVENLTQL